MLNELHVRHLNTVPINTASNFKVSLITLTDVGVWPTYRSEKALQNATQSKITYILLTYFVFISMFKRIGTLFMNLVAQT
jgi:hypothetical protein